MARFYIGQPVVCIDGRVSLEIRTLYPSNRWPVQGQRYVIREYVPLRRGIPAVLLHEIRNKKVCYFDGTVYEGGFAETRFAPVTESQIRALMTMTVREPEDA